MQTMPPINELSFVAAKAIETPTAPSFALLAFRGERLPGQTSIMISEPDIKGVRSVNVTFEVRADIPEGCALSCNRK